MSKWLPAAAIVRHHHMYQHHKWKWLFIHNKCTRLIVTLIFKSICLAPLSITHPIITVIAHWVHCIISSYYHHYKVMLLKVCCCDNNTCTAKWIYKNVYPLIAWINNCLTSLWNSLYHIHTQLWMKMILGISKCILPFSLCLYKKWHGIINHHLALIVINTQSLIPIPWIHTQIRVRVNQWLQLEALIWSQNDTWWAEWMVCAQDRLIWGLCYVSWALYCDPADLSLDQSSDLTS